MESGSLATPGPVGWRTTEPRALLSVGEPWGAQLSLVCEARREPLVLLFTGAHVYLLLLHACAEVARKSSLHCLYTP